MFSISQSIHRLHACPSIALPPHSCSHLTLVSCHSPLRDVVMVLHNALAFNADASPISIAAVKLLNIFDRLFLEGVLHFRVQEDERGQYSCLESQYQPDLCMGCQNIYQDDGQETIICDRCGPGKSGGCISWLHVVWCSCVCIYSHIHYLYVLVDVVGVMLAVMWSVCFRHWQRCPEENGSVLLA